VEGVQTLMKALSLRPSDLLASQRSGYVSLMSEKPTLASASFECGVTLLLLLPSRRGNIGFFPEFHRVWWRGPYRWAKQFSRISELSEELSRLGPRRACPFFAAATANLLSWERAWRGCRGSLETQIEFVVPSEQTILDSAGRFLEDWNDSIGLESTVADSSTGAALEFDQAFLRAMTSMPSGSPADEELLAVVLEDLSSWIWPAHASLAGIFPNLLEFMLPSTLSPPARRGWLRVLDLRLRWVVEAGLPQHYPHIQGLASRDQWEREFVGEADRNHSRGRDLIGLARMDQLFDAGLRLEADFPVLGRDPFAACGRMLVPHG
jgi:hypothetical protein